MVSSDSTSSPSDPTFSGPDGNREPATPTASTLHSIGAGRLFVCAIVAGLLAGLASVLIGERILDRYKGDLLPPIEISPSAANVQRWKDARIYSATFTFATLGGLLGLALGLAGGLARRIDLWGNPGGNSGAGGRSRRRWVDVAFPRVNILQDARPAIGRPRASLNDTWRDLVSGGCCWRRCIRSGAWGLGPVHGHVGRRSYGRARGHDRL